MKYSLRQFSTGLIFAISLAGCDGGSSSKSADDIAADSALAADLAIANRDTLLVDSIGEYRPADAAERARDVDTATSESDRMTDVTGGGTTSSPIGGARSDPARPAPDPAASRGESPAASDPAPRTSAPSSSNAAPTVSESRPSGPKKTGAAACNSPALEDQSECVRVSLASADMRLNRIYRALITEMRRQEGVRGDQKDPPSVQRLRVAQRAWLVYRDTECRRRGRGREGRLWARPRVRCLGEFSVRRANELADNFSRLTAP